MRFLIIIAIIIACISLTSCTRDSRDEAPETTSVHSKSISDAKSNQSESCKTILRIDNDLGIASNEGLEELAIRVDSSGQSSTALDSPSNSVEDYCLDVSIEPGARRNIHFFVDHDTPVWGHFRRGTWMLIHGMRSRKSADGRTILDVPLSGFVYWDDIARSRAP